MPNRFDPIWQSPTGRELLQLLARERFARGASREVITTLHPAYQEIARRLLLDYSQLTKGDRGRLAALFRDLSRILHGGYEVANTQLLKTLGAYQEIEATLAATEITGFTGTSIGPLLSTATAGRIAELPIEGTGLGQWFSRMRDTMTARIRQQIQVGLTLGESTGTIASRIFTLSTTRGVSAWRMARRDVVNFVRTTTTAVQATASRDVYIAAGPEVVDEVQIRAVLDSRTTPICFSGSTRVVPLGELRKVFRRSYQGQMRIITTATGEQLTVTPNHPILTAQGWRAAKEVRPSDQIINCYFGDAVTIGDDVKVHPSFAAIADALFDPTISEIFTDRSSAAAFHGDGMGRDEQIEIAVPNDKLRHGFNPFPMQSQKYRTLVWLHNAGAFDAQSGLGSLRVVRLPAIQSPEFNARASQMAIETRLADLQADTDFSRAHPSPVHFDCALFEGVWGSAWSINQQAQAFEKTGDSRRGRPVDAGDRSSRFAVMPALSQIVGVRSEFGSHTVYNLESDLGMYIAGRTLVQNCRKLDGKRFKVTDPQLISTTPPFHIGCRTTLVPVVNPKALGLQELPRSLGPANWQTYGGWLGQQSHATQDVILGSGRGDLWRAGKISLSDMVTDDGALLTVDQLRHLYATAIRPVPVS